MISQLLNRDFMSKSTRRLHQAIRAQSKKYEKGDSDVISLMEDAGVDLADLQRAESALKTVTDESSNSFEQHGEVFFPRDPIVSIAQSALQQYCDEKRQPNVISKPRGAAQTKNVPVTNSEMDTTLAQFLSGPPPERGLWKKFELLDIGWANCLTAIGVRKLFSRHPFNQEPAVPVKIGNRARVILVGDWGSGLDRAQKVAGVIRDQIDDQSAKSRDKHVIHLGDVYYSGLSREYENNFLKYWPVLKKEGDDITSWTLNANHDMFSGGWGYFEYVLRDDARFKRHRDRNGNASSFFSLENDNWQILGLDTGYHDNLIFDAHDLYGDQAGWVANRIAHNPDKKCILLSHHQPFSAFEKDGEKLLKKLEEPLVSGGVRAWFWGHEHRCALYQPREGIEYPRCIGHGGVPFYVSKKKLPFGVSYEYKEGFRDLVEKWNYFGFAVMDFEDQVINVRYINERGNTHHEERLVKT